MPIKLNTASSGSVTLDAANTASNFTITVPATTATMAINGPAFSAYKSASAQSISSGTFTVVTFDVEEFDTNNCFASNRFTPNVAGYYQVTACVNVLSTGGNAGIFVTSIYKNGSDFKRGQDLRGLSVSAAQQFATALIYMNGTTDYLEAAAYNNSVSPSILTGANSTYFQASMVRAA